MRIAGLLSLLLLFCSAAFSQPVLLPDIGLSALPADTDSVCTIPWYLGNFDNSGLFTGDTAYDFTLYTRSGQAFHLEDTLAAGKAVLLVAGSYTCPVFRNRIPAINQVVATYGNQLSVVVVYTLEAHPVVDISPYFGYVNPGSANLAAGILYRQPLTYGERKVILDDMLTAVSIDANVVLDGPCNNWWEIYGPAPNNGYLIQTDGTVFAKHGWFHKFPENIFCDIDSLLGTNSGLCQTAGSGGSFSLELISNDTVWGAAGNTLYADMRLVNNTASDVQVLTVKLTENYAPNWETSFCSDVCYPAETDTTILLVPANSWLDFHLYFYSDQAAAGISQVKLGFRNEANFSNSFTQWLTGITTAATGVVEEMGKGKLTVFPNPAASSFFVLFPSEKAGTARLELLDLKGSVVLSETYDVFPGENRFSVATDRLPAGLYVMKITDERILKSGRVLVEHGN